jgi:hypothetical protein
MTIRQWLIQMFGDMFKKVAQTVPVTVPPITPPVVLPPADKPATSQGACSFDIVANPAIDPPEEYFARDTERQECGLEIDRGQFLRAWMYLPTKAWSKKNERYVPNSYWGGASYVKIVQTGASRTDCDLELKCVEQDGYHYHVWGWVSKCPQDGTLPKDQTMLGLTIHYTHNDTKHCVITCHKIP